MSGFELTIDLIETAIDIGFLLLALGFRRENYVERVLLLIACSCFYFVTSYLIDYKTNIIVGEYFVTIIRLFIIAFFLCNGGHWKRFTVSQRSTPSSH